MEKSSNTTPTNKTGSPAGISDTRDDVAKDLLELINSSYPGKALTMKELMVGIHCLDTNQLMMQLCSYIVRRDHTIHNHAYKLGKASNGK